METNPKGLITITANLPAFLPKLQELIELLIANAVMVGEIPTPTGKESSRMRFLLDRFTESSLQAISQDEAGNAMAILPCQEPENTTLVVARADFPIPKTVDPTMRVDPDKITDPVKADNWIGLAIVATLPNILERLGIRLNNNLLLLAASKSLGEGDLAGLRFFLENNLPPLEGDKQGRMTCKSLGEDLSALNEHNLPTLTLGLTLCEKFQEPDEAIQIQPLLPGISQLVCLLHTIDRNFCHDAN
jgi:tripeptide aminopeptidase